MSLEAGPQSPARGWLAVEEILRFFLSHQMEIMKDNLLRLFGRLSNTRSDSQ